MNEQITALLTKHRSIFLYGIFGVLTTLVNYAVYLAWIAAFAGKYANVTATLAAWVIAVIFAYFTNRKWVFDSKVRGFASRLRECASFFAMRIVSGVIDLGIMYVAVDIMGGSGKVVKLLSNIFVIVLNYVFSKLFVFAAPSRK